MFYKYIPIKRKENEKSIHSILLEEDHDYSTTDRSFQSVGLNTGNQVPREAIMRNLTVEKMNYQEYCMMSETCSGVPVIVTDLIWINENSNFDYLYDRVQKFKDIIFVPMSVGLQAKNFGSEFKLNNSVKNVLSVMQERAVIGVRGEYTADVLNKNGIKNIEIIGCPSLYYADDPDFKIVKNKPIDSLCRVSVNFRTFYGLLSKEEKHFLTYCANGGYDFIEQTAFEFILENVGDIDYYNYVAKWIKRKKKSFFHINEWKEFLAEFQFSMGLRFHGNVVALWNKIPSLFIVIDSRTEELARYFELPFIKIRDFDERKPIEYYYELADCETFNKTYRKKYLKYREFLRKNSIRK